MILASSYLKMYSLYIQNFNKSQALILDLCHKHEKFNELITNIQQLPECGNLKLSQHMLVPVQRIPRYQLLLQDYLKKMPENAPDYEKATKALVAIKEAALHSNQTIGQQEKFEVLRKIKNNLTDVDFEIVEVGRELLKEGKMTKISARSGEKQDRYLYLFNDYLVCCAPLNRLNKKYRVTAKLDLEGMQVKKEIRSSVNPNAVAYNYTFCICGLQRTMEFQASNDEDKNTWVDAISGAMNEQMERKSTFKQRSGSINSDSTPSLPVQSPTSTLERQNIISLTDDLVAETDLGIRAPRWIKDNEVSMCMGCSKQFNAIRRRRHHCRACGRVVCAECSDHKQLLKYDPVKPQRVCDKCHEYFDGKVVRDEARKKGILEVQANEINESSALADYLYYNDSDKKKNWTKMWCVIPNNQLCIYFYAAHQDVKAHHTLPLPGFSVTDSVVEKPKGVDHEFSFKVCRNFQVYNFVASSKEQKDRWMSAIERGTTGNSVTREYVHSLGKKGSLKKTLSSMSTARKRESQTSCSSDTSSSTQRPISSSSEDDFKR